ncbi:MAG: BatD family protein [Gammaproteobacteria bacterium]
MNAGRWALLLVLAVLAAPAGGAQADFSVHVDKHAIALGQPLTVSIRARNLGNGLDRLNLKALKRDFHIGSMTTSSAREQREGQGFVTDRMSLTVYPLHSGTLPIGPLTFMGHTSRPLSVTVRNTGPDAPAVRFKAWIDPSGPLVRQVTTLHLTIYDEGSVQWAPVRLPQASGLYTRRISATRREEKIDGMQQTVYRYEWALTPLQAGDWKIAFPMLSADRFGTPLRYPLPPVRFHVNPAPAYLPVYVPIGRVSIHGQTLPGQLTLRQPANWILTVTGEGLTREGIAKLLGPLDGGSAVRFYPPTIVKESQGRGDGTLQTWRVTLPFRPLRAGLLTLPTVSVAYFDPVTGRIASATASGPRVRVAGPVGHALRVGGYGLALLVALGWGAYRLRNRYRRIRARRAALTRVRAAADVPTLRHALMAFPALVRPSSTLASPITLAQWLTAIQYQCGPQTELAQLAQYLDAAQFGADGTLSESRLSALKDRAIAMLRRLKPLRQDTAPREARNIRNG